MASASRGRASTSLDQHSSDSSGGGDKLFAAAAERNKAPIFDVLRDRLPSHGVLLEVASGTGQHAAFFAEQLKSLSSSSSPPPPSSSSSPSPSPSPSSSSSSLVIQPTEADESALPSIRAHTSGMRNVLPPKVLDVARDPPEAWLIGGRGGGGGVGGGERGEGRVGEKEQGAEKKEEEEGKREITAVYCANLTHISPWAATLGLMRGCGAVLKENGALFLYGPFAVDGKPATPSDAAFDASLRARDAAWGYRDIETEIKPAAEESGLSFEEKIDMPANNFLLVFRKK